MKSPALVNAAQMHVDHPATFHRPPATELAAVNAGSLVKVCDNAERFWVKVNRRTGEVLTGRVENLLLSGRLQLGDKIKFHTDNIYDIATTENTPQ